ncbi:hypothetical protein AaE_016018, partial [Aphanomyces astaci]
PLLTGRSDPDPEKPNATVPCAVKPLRRSPLHAGVIHKLLTSSFNQMDTPTPHLRRPTTPVAAPFDSPAPAATPTGATNLPPVPDDDNMGQGDERGFAYNAPALLDQIRAADIHPPVQQVPGPTRAWTFYGRLYQKRLAMWDMGNRDYRGVTETEWVFEEEPQDLDVFKKRLTMAIRFGTTILDTDSHIGKMLDNLIRALERDDQAWVLYQKGKTVVDIMLALQRNKPLKSNVYRFVDWLRVYTAGYYLYAPVEDEKTSAPPATAAAAPSRPSKRGRSEGSVSSSSGPPRRAPDLEKDSAKYERKKATCLNAAPGESERLLTEKMDKWESARNKKVTKLQGSANKSLGREAKIEGIVSVTTTFLDTGSDSLERAGVEIKVILLEPSVIQPIWPSICTALSAVQAWVDSSSNAAELLISRAVMERLGFSEDELLSHAFAKQEVWDLSDVDKPSAMASVSRLTQVAASSVECGDDGIHCATPNIQVPSAEDEEGERWLKR